MMMMFFLYLSTAAVEYQVLLSVFCLEHTIFCYIVHLHVVYLVILGLLHYLNVFCYKDGLVGFSSD
jgi:hypothetical protein